MMLSLGPVYSSLQIIKAMLISQRFDLGLISV